MTQAMQQAGAGNTGAGGLLALWEFAMAIPHMVRGHHVANEAYEDVIFGGKSRLHGN